MPLSLNISFFSYAFRDNKITFHFLAKAGKLKGAVIISKRSVSGYEYRCTSQTGEILARYQRDTSESEKLDNQFAFNNPRSRVKTDVFDGAWHLGDSELPARKSACGLDALSSPTVVVSICAGLGFPVCL